MPFAVIPSKARYGFPSHGFCAMNPSSIRMPRKERFLTSQTPFGMMRSRLFCSLLGCHPYCTGCDAKVQQCEPGDPAALHGFGAFAAS